MDAVSLNTDVLVIGSGVAGVAAALEHRRCGKSVVILSNGPGATSVSSGAWDFGPVTQIEKSLDNSREDWKNIYSQLLVDGAAVAPANALLQGIEALQSPLLSISTSKAKPFLLPTSSGSVKSTFAAQSIQAKADIFAIAGKQVGFVAGPRWRIQAQSLCASWNEAAKRKGVAISIKPFPILWPNKGKDWPIPRLAAELEALADRRSDFLQAIRATLAEQRVDFLLFPPLFATTAMFEDFQKNLSVEMGECLSTLEPVAGLRLTRSLHHLLAANDIQKIEGRVLSHEEEGERITRIKYQAPNSSILNEIAAKHFTLATGKLFGGGVQIGYEEIVEPVFRLPLFSHRSGQPLNRRNQLVWQEREFQDEQLWEHVGVWVDEKFRPMDSTRSFVFENVTAAGSIIGGVDLPRNNLGLGWMAFSGRECARMVP